ncbi:MAG: hypothetical protein WDZ61_00045 [Parcubacteria group bacterium]
MFKVFRSANMLNDYGRIGLPNGWKSTKLFSMEAAQRLKIKLGLMGIITVDEARGIWVDIMEADFPETFSERMHWSNEYWEDYHKEIGFDAY